MNVHPRDLEREPSRAEARAALDLLRRWANDVTPEEVTALDPLVARLIPALFAALIARLVALPLLRLLLIPLGLAVAILAFLLFAALIDLALRLGQKPQVMFGMLLEILHRHAVIAKLGIARQLVVLVNDLLRRAADLALGTRAVENPVDDIPDTAVGGIVAARLARPGFGRSHM